MITYRKGNLFDAPEDEVLIHACNTSGVWGSGIASTFRSKFQDAFALYRKECLEESNLRNNLGKVVAHGRVVCIINGHFEFMGTDKWEQTVLYYTKKCLKDIIRSFPKDTKFHMPKINSGIFAIPWSETEKVILDVLKDTPANITVWEL